MRVKFKDFVVEDLGELTYGTCELCFSTYEDVDNTLILKDVEAGDTFDVPLYYRDGWGRKEEISIDDVIAFASWISENEILSYEEWMMTIIVISFGLNT